MASSCGRFHQRSVLFIVFPLIMTCAYLSMTSMKAQINYDSGSNWTQLFDSFPLVSVQRNMTEEFEAELSPDIKTEPVTTPATHPAKTDEMEGEKQSEIKTEPVTTQTSTEPVYNAEREMNRNAEYTNTVCQSLTDSEKDLFYEGMERWRASRTWTSNTSRFSLLFTPIPKCGWTTWQVLFYKDAGKLDIIKTESRWAWDNDYHEVGLSVAVIRNATYESYKDRLLMVRHPYERLVSAYNDKALHAGGLYTKQKHKPCDWFTLRYTLPLSFPQFVACILKTAQKSLIKGPSASLSSRTAGIWLDHHWAPQSHLSLPCRANYTMIGKYDRFQDNSNFMIKRLKLNATLTVNNHKGKGKSLDYWYNQLSIEQVKQLQILYKYDFLLFGFDSTPPGHNRTKEVISNTAGGRPKNKAVFRSPKKLILLRPSRY